MVSMRDMMNMMARQQMMEQCQDMMMDQMLQHQSATNGTTIHYK
jgi:hypothetical protein